MSLIGGSTLGSKTPVSLIDVLRDTNEVEVFIGPPCGSFKLLDKSYRYMSFVNGAVHEDGARINFVGADVENAQDKLRDISTKVILEHVRAFNCKALVFRSGTENGQFEIRPANVTDFDGKVEYYPASVVYRTRVAFIV